MFENLVFPVAIGAERRLRDATGQGLAVHAGSKLLNHLAVANPAGVGNRGSKGLRFRQEQFMRAAVAEPAVGSPGVPTFSSLAVDATGVIASLVMMTGDALGFGNVGRMRILLVTLVAGVARQARMGALLQLGT